MTHVKVTGTNYVRDIESMALINIDDNSKNEYYTKSKLLQTQKEELNNVKSEINELKNDITEIKSLMIKLLQKE